MRSFVRTAENGEASAEAVTATVVEAPRTAQVASAPKSVTRYIDTPYMQGQITASDIKTPYLSCVAGVGPKSALHSPGTIILGELVLSKAPENPKQPTPALRILFIRPIKTFVENLPYNPAPDAPRPRVYKTEAEVLQVGGTLEYIGRTAPSFVPKCTSAILVRQPASLDDDSFCFIADDKQYAPAMVSFQKTGYSAAKTLWTDLSLSLKNDPTATFYDLFWAKEPKGQNWVWVPKIVRVRDEKPSDTLRGIARKLSGASATTDEGSEE